MLRHRGGGRADARAPPPAPVERLLPDELREHGPGAVLAFLLVV